LPIRAEKLAASFDELGAAVGTEALGAEFVTRLRRRGLRQSISSELEAVVRNAHGTGIAVVEGATAV